MKEALLTTLITVLLTLIGAFGSFQLAVFVGLAMIIAKLTP